jgi:transcriptional regulator with XRE-family HTH domain
MNTNIEKNLEGFPARLRHIVGESGLTQAQFAESAGIALHLLKDVLRGQIRPSAELVQKVITKHSVDAVWLVTGQKHQVGELAPQESVLISNYRLLAATEQATIAKMVAALAAESRPSKSKD